MRRYTPPFHLWPLRHHLVAAAALLFVLVLLIALGAHGLTRQDTQLREATAALQQDLRQAQARSQHVDSEADLLNSLPAPTRSDDITRDIARFAQTHGVQLNSVGIEPRKASQTQWPQYQFQVAAQSNYPDCKAWLAELLDRYPSLVLQNLSLQTNPQNPGQLDVRASLVWYVRQD